jgi:hypothetical protein
VYFALSPCAFPESGWHPCTFASSLMAWVFEVSRVPLLCR